MNQFRVTFLNPQLLIGMDVREGFGAPIGPQDLDCLSYGLFAQADMNSDIRRRKIRAIRVAIACLRECPPILSPLPRRRPDYSECRPVSTTTSDGSHGFRYAEAAVCLRCLPRAHPFCRHCRSRRLQAAPEDWSGEVASRLAAPIFKLMTLRVVDEQGQL